MKKLKIRDGRGITTIPQLLENSAARWPDATALQIKRGGGWDKYSYEEVLSLVKRLAEFLVKEAGLKKGDHFGVVGENRPEWAVAYLAIQWAGGTVIPLDPKLSPSERGYIIGASKTKGVIASGHFVAEMMDHAVEMDNLDIVVSMDKHPDVVDYPNIWSKYPKGIQRAQLGIEDLAVILFTSGTTGLPKGVMLSHKNIVSNIDAIYQCIIAGPDDMFYSILPMHHVFEATTGFLFPLSVGSTVSYASSLRPDVMQEEMREVRPTLMLVVPLILEKFLKGIRKKLSKLPRKKRFALGLLKGVFKIADLFAGGKASKKLYKTVREQMGLDRARYIISGGGPLPRWVSAGLEEMGFPVVQGYGLSEASPVVTVNPPDAPKNASVGLALPGCEIKIIDQDSQGAGEITVRAPFVMVGYYENPQATKEVITPDGWLLTGDLGYMDSEGFLYITGRKKALIVNKGGKNIYPEELEEKLAMSHIIEEVLVFGGKNPKTGEEDVQAIIFPNMEELGRLGLTSEEKIYDMVKKEVEKVNSQLATYKRIRRFALRFEELPKTTTKKIKRHLFANTWIEPGQKVI